MTTEALAVENCVMLGVAGSELYGTALETGDKDYMGVALESEDYVIGLREFEQWQYHSAGEGIRSAPGDIDVTIYTLRKWARLAAAGNPTVLLLGFTPRNMLIVDSHTATRVRANMHLFWSRQAAARFLGYLMSQRDQMLGLKGKRHTNRKELVEEHGYDTKFAYHAVRLGMQGIEFMDDKRITLPMPSGDRNTLLAIRRGEYTKDEVVAWIDELADVLARYKTRDDIPAEADLDLINDWLIQEYQLWWQLSGSMSERRASTFNGLLAA